MSGSKELWVQHSVDHTLPGKPASALSTTLPCRYPPCAPRLPCCRPCTRTMPRKTSSSLLSWITMMSRTKMRCSFVHSSLPTPMRRMMISPHPSPISTMHPCLLYCGFKTRTTSTNNLSTPLIYRTTTPRTRKRRSCASASASLLLPVSSKRIFPSLAKICTPLALFYKAFLTRVRILRRELTCEIFYVCSVW